MIKKPAVFIFVISVLGLIVITSVFFTNKDLSFQDRPSSVTEPFLCNDQSCNVILIIPETLSARHMGIYGYERDTTPFIDEFFGKEGIVFENAWSTAPWTVPSFAAFFTSQLASEVFVEGRTDKLSDTIPTFIDVLGENGIPKLAAHTWTLLPLPSIDLNLITRFNSDERFQAEDSFLFLKANEWIEEQAQKDGGQPFFLLLQPFAPHRPYNSPEPYRYFFDAPLEYPGPVFATQGEMFGIRDALRQGEDLEKEINRFRLQYDQEIRYIDSEFESFVDRIPEEVLRNTVFIFTSDHGEAFGQHKNIDHGLSLYEEEIHVPFLVIAPGVKPARVREPITLIDLGPTILDIFGIKSPEIFQGISLLPALRERGLQLEERIVKTERIDPLDIIHDTLNERELIEIFATNIKIRTEPLLGPRERAVRKQEWKLIQRADGTLELYNLEKDYWEQDNLVLRWHSLSKEEKEKTFPLFEMINVLFPR